MLAPSHPWSPHLVMCQGVESLPVILNLSGDVFILQDHPRPASLSPLCRGNSSISDRPLGPSHGTLRTPVQASAWHHLRVHPKTGARRCSQRRGAEAQGDPDSQVWFSSQQNYVTDIGITSPPLPTCSWWVATSARSQCLLNEEGRGLPWRLSGKESSHQSRRHGFDS